MRSLRLAEANVAKIRVFVFLLTSNHLETFVYLCRGGNVTITAVKLEADTSTPEATNTTLKQRTAAFNGTLGFFTLGLQITVLGQFSLKR